MKSPANEPDPSVGSPADPAAGIEDAAADWVARRHAGLSDHDAAEFRRWLAADPQHGQAFREIDHVWETLNQPRREGSAPAALHELEHRERRRVRRNAFILATTSLGVAAAVVLSLLPARPPAVGPNPSPTIVHRPNRQTLADGSAVELNAGAEILVAFSDTARRVKLRSGEALFQVARDASRPFVVVAGKVEVRAIGTAVAVRHDAAHVDVLVTEGRVSVNRTVAVPEELMESPLQPVYVDAGRRVRVSDALPGAMPPPLESVTQAQISQALAWRGRRLEFTGTPLLEAVELFNEQNSLQLSVADTRTGTLKITGIFWSDDPEGFVRLLESGLNVEAKRAGDFIVLQDR
jgi:transmembrane sensor